MSEPTSYDEALSAGLREYLEELDPWELINAQEYFISQPHLVNDMKFYLNDKERKLNKRAKKVNLYENDK